MSQEVSIVLFVLIVVVVILMWRVRVLTRKFREMEFNKRSRDVLHGKSWEQFAPFMEHYPYNPENFRFIGTPVDGIAFEDDRLIFIEFKTGKSALNNRQRIVKDHVEQKRVEWHEIRW